MNKISLDIDTGMTAGYLLRTRQPRSIEACTLLDMLSFSATLNGSTARASSPALQPPPSGPRFEDRNRLMRVIEKTGDLIGRQPIGGTMVKTPSLLVRLRHSAILRLAIVAHTVMLALAWTAIARGKGTTKAFMPWELSLGKKGIPKKVTDSFTWTPVKSFEANEKLPAMLEIGGRKSRIWSVSQHEFHIGKVHVACPIMAVITADNGSSMGAIAGVLRARTDIRDGLNSDGYRIEAVREIKAGQSIAALLVIGDKYSSVLSIESTKDREPLFAAFQNKMRPKECASVVEIWRIVIEHIAHSDGIR